VFRQALQEVPKSGEVWCEGARINMNPLGRRFDLNTARRFLDFAIQVPFLFFFSSLLHFFLSFLPFFPSFLSFFLSFLLPLVCFLCGGPSIPHPFTNPSPCSLRRSMGTRLSSTCGWSSFSTGRWTDSRTCSSSASMQTQTTALSGAHARHRLSTGPPRYDTHTDLGTLSPRICSLLSSPLL
jgi:hypothetical protein